MQSLIFFYGIFAFIGVSFILLVGAMSQNMPVEEYHGQHRRTAASIHGDPAQVASDGAGGAASGGSIVSVTLPSRTILPYTGTGTSGLMMYGPSLAMHAAVQQQIAMQQAAMARNAMRLGAAVTAPPHRPTDLKSDGIRSGEVIGWRVWRVSHCKLFSFVVDDEWKPSAPMNGRPADGYGIHAYKSPHGMFLDGYMDRVGYWVVGTVALWGDVIEHEGGFRAEYGRVHSLVTWGALVSSLDRETISKEYLSWLADPAASTQTST